MQCPQCKTDVHPSFVMCPNCQYFLDYPNVRAAQGSAEKRALDHRYGVARDDVRARSCEHVLDKFEDSLRHSKAVLCRRWGILTKSFESGDELFKTFYKQLADEDRRPKDSYYDRARLLVDDIFFPYYREHIHFAALSLNGTGPASFGECSVVLREEAISHRATVFEENTLVFLTKHRVPPLGQSPTPGHCAVWEDRHRLAAAKLHEEIDDQTEPDKFPAILLKQNGSTGTDEFIEVHIYGKLELTNVESFAVPRPTRRDDKVLAKRVTRKLRDAGAKIERV